MTDSSRQDGFEFGGFKLHRRLRVLEDPEGDPVRLNARAFEALLCFVERPGQVIDRETLMETLWPDSIVDDNNLAQTISSLRRALGDEMIVTVPKRGYQFSAAVRPLDADSPAAASGAAVTGGAPSAERTGFAVRSVTLAAISVLAVAGLVAAALYLPGNDGSLDALASGSARLPDPFPDPRNYRTRPATDSPEASAAFQRALAIIQEYGGPRDEAYALLSEAIEADNGFMPAYLHRGVVGFLMARTDYNRSHIPDYDNRFPEFIEQARADAARAMQLDSSYGYTHALAGGISLLLNDTVAAEASFDRALQLGPNDPDVLGFVASAYIGTGRRDAALEVLAGLEDDALLDMRTAELLNVAGRNGPSREILARNRANAPDDPLHITMSGYAAAIEGDYALALDELLLAERLMVDVTDDNRRLMLLRNQIYAYGRIGHGTEARRLAALLDQPSTEDPEANAMLWLEVNLGIGDVDRAYEWAEVVASQPRAPFFSGHLHFMYNSYMDPRLDEPRFMALRRQMGYPV